MLPFFYQPSVPAGDSFTLDEATSKHVIQVLRMQEGEPLIITDGKGLKCTTRIAVAERKRCLVRITERHTAQPRPSAFSLGIAFTKNNSRNEWLLEKVTELGAEHIYPIISARTEKDKFNAERLNNILVSAMLQSQQSFLPVLHEPVALKKLVAGVGEAQKFVAHCMDGDTKRSLVRELQPGRDTLVLIGPEGDFTADEVSLCLAHDFVPVSLGDNRLRTETAGLYACTVFNALNYA
ncbi:RsmE family RNA methyltransferase [Taibaiella chishuiensis]|uniref:Ribosomal RNA small subunit methyltransferase E n=1 Tax=Taibaiella chishuiensis TaxID=1434707 RepID=A0A2P8D4N0_9BACT|nr:RsmE family RNA methyltransferase [Taibaiella chishuiensis]PSK92165.1 16S rRNA (uracil1498-N3)-methyltransferase [Taibaiella chishuiensis]